MLAYAKPAQKKEQSSQLTDKGKSGSPQSLSPNLTGIPDNTKTRFENLSGFSFDDVRINYNSSKPAPLQTPSNMFANMVQFKSGTGNVIQRLIANAVSYRTAAIGAFGMIGEDSKTAAVSNNRFAVTPEVAGIGLRAAVGGYTGKTHAGPIPTVAPGDQYGNHAEKKLIHHDAGCTDIGVSRNICNSCLNAICNHHATLNHVADPTSIYEVTQNRLRSVTAAGAYVPASDRVPH